MKAKERAAEPAEDEQPRDANGRFGPREPGTAEEEAERRNRRDLRRLVKFAEVLEAAEKYRYQLRTAGKFGNADTDEVLDAMLADVRGRLLFDEHPILVQRLAPLDKQPLGAQIAMGRDPSLRIRRRYGGAGFGSGDLAMPVHLEVPAKTLYETLGRVAKRMKKTKGKKR